MELVGFVQSKDGQVIEYLPYNEQMKDLDQRRSLFFNMYNFYMEKDLRFTKKEFHGCKNIKSVFTKKIDLLLLKSLTFGKCKNFQVDIASTKIINAYQKNRVILTLKKPKLQVAKLISLVYRQGSFSLMIDLEDMFLNLVYERIKKVNKGSKVVMGANEIIIYKPNPNESPTLVIPVYKTIAKQNMKEDIIVNQNINIAMDHLRADKIRQIFLVFPKSNGFSKYIDLKFHNDIKLEDDEYRVKMIPYSFSFCIKNSKCRKKSIK